MRTRAEIEAEAKFWSEADDMLLRRILEVLLDIRDLLQPRKVDLVNDDPKPDYVIPPQLRHRIRRR